MTTKSTAVLAALILAMSASVASAQQTDAGDSNVNPCQSAPFSDFDFWVGDWVAFDYDTGVVQGIDRIESTNNGCTVLQEWSQMTDRYKSPGADERYAGLSISSVLPDGTWQQVWVGNRGGTIVVKGQLDEDGRMVLSSGEQMTPDGRTYKRIWYFAPESDGTVHSWGEVYIKDEDGGWSDPQVPWNLRYVSRNAAPALEASTAAD